MGWSSWPGLGSQWNATSVGWATTPTYLPTDTRLICQPRRRNSLCKLLQLPWCRIKHQWISPLEMTGDMIQTTPVYFSNQNYIEYNPPPPGGNKSHIYLSQKKMWNMITSWASHTGGLVLCGYPPTINTWCIYFSTRIYCKTSVRPIATSLSSWQAVRLKPIWLGTCPDMGAIGSTQMGYITSSIYPR